MVKKIKVTSGFAASLPSLQGREFSFSRDINLIWGANASGKTTLLSIIAAYCFIPDGGWTRLLKPLDFSAALRDGSINLPHALRNIAPGRCEADVVWDRTPTFFANGKDEVHNGCFADEENGSPDGMTNMSEQISALMSRFSSGATRINKIQKVVELLANVPDFNNVTLKPMNSVWTRCMTDQLAYLQVQPKRQRVTLLLDEPDRSLDLRNQIFFWSRLVPSLAAKAQVIVATHNPLALAMAIRRGGTVHQMAINGPAPSELLAEIIEALSIVEGSERHK